MKTIVISDVHLRWPFDEKKYNFLVGLFNQSDLIIIDGDFIDLYLSSLQWVLKSQWCGLFNILKEKKAIYIKGNHDELSTTNQSILQKDFGIEIQDEYVLKAGEVTFFIRHGHKIDPTLDMIYPERFLFKPVTWLHTIRNDTMVRIFGRDYFKKNQYENERMKKFSITLPNKSILVTGHSHLSEESLDENFINTGCIDYGLATYLRIEDDTFKLIETRYR